MFILNISMMKDRHFQKTVLERKIFFIFSSRCNIRGFPTHTTTRLPTHRRIRFPLTTESEFSPLTENIIRFFTQVQYVFPIKRSQLGPKIRNTSKFGKFWRIFAEKKKVCGHCHRMPHKSTSIIVSGIAKGT